MASSQTMNMFDPWMTFPRKVARGRFYGHAHNILNCCGGPMGNSNTMALHQWRPMVLNSSDSSQDGKEAAISEYRARASARENRHRPRSKRADLSSSLQPSGSSKGEGLGRGVLRDRTNRLTASDGGTPPSGYVPPYEWFRPKETLVQRRCRTEQRREELLQLLYQQDIGSGDIDELVSEWVSLVVERDKLLHEQVNEQYCMEYFRDLRHLLQAQPALDGGSEELNLRDVLMDLERCVTDYCQKRNMLSESAMPLTCSNTFAKPLFFHAPPCSQDHAHFPPTDEMRPHCSGHLLDHETGQTSVRIQVPHTASKSKTPALAEDDSSGSLFKEPSAAAAEIPVSECLYVSLASQTSSTSQGGGRATQAGVNTASSGTSSPAGLGALAMSHSSSAPTCMGVPSQGLFSDEGPVSQGVFSSEGLGKAASHGLFSSDAPVVAPSQGVYRSEGLANAPVQGLYSGDIPVNAPGFSSDLAVKAPSQGLFSGEITTKASEAPSVQPSEHLFTSQFNNNNGPHMVPSVVVPPPRPILPPPTSCSPPPIPPSPPLIQTSPAHHRVMKGATGTVQFAGMSSALSARQSEREGTNIRGSAPTKPARKRKFFGFGSSRDETDKGDEPSLTPVQTEERKNLLDEISSMGHAVLKRTDRPRSPGGTPVKPPPTSNQPALSSEDSGMLQRALMSKFRSLHSTPLNHSRFHRGDYSSSLDFSNAWSDLNASVMYEDPDISSSPFSGYTPNQSSSVAGAGNESGNKVQAAHNSSSAV